MFTIDFSSKKVRLAMRFFTYGVMAVISAMLTTLLVLMALGYRLDRNFTFAQGGLVQFYSSPSNANVVIDGHAQGTTPNKLNMAAGQHTITMNLAGYRQWSKAFDLAPGQLLWLNYARLIPNSITTATLKEFPSIVAALPSPDQHWLLLQTSADAPNFTLVDYGDPTKPKFTDFQLPDGLFTKKDGKYGTFKMIEWDLQSKFVLIEHQQSDGTIEFARVDRSQPNDAVNLTRLFGLNITEAHFSGNGSNIIFAKTDTVLRRLDVGGPSASAALVDGVTDFTVYGEDTIAFTSLQDQTTGDDSTKQQEVGIYSQGKVMPVRTVPVSQHALFAYSEYDTHAYLAIGSTDNGQVDVLRDATSTGSSKETSVFTRFNLGAPVSSLSFSSNGRMLVAQHGNMIATYDIDTAKTYTKTLDFGSAKTGQFRWLDDYYLWSDDDGSLRIFEFDGTNGSELTTVMPGSQPMLSADGKRLLSVNQNDETGVFLLQASKLTLGN